MLQFHLTAFVKSGIGESVNLWACLIRVLSSFRSSFSVSTKRLISGMIELECLSEKESLGKVTYHC